MFETLRKMIFPIIIIVLLFFTAMIVLEWGLGFSRRSDYVDSNLAGTINGEEISWTEFNRIYDNMYQVEIGDSDEELPDFKKKEIQNRAWQQLVHDHLLMQQVAKYNITVTDEEVYAYLRFSPPQELQQSSYFQTDGRFDYQKYVSTMADPNASGFWASIEPIVKREILKQKLQMMILETAHVTEDEVQATFMAANEKITVGMVNVGYERFSRPPPSPTDEELKKYFTEHSADYKVAERATLNLVLIEKKPEPYDWEVGFNKAKEIYDSIQAGADFAEMAKRYSEDGSAENGGDIGWFPKGQMVAEFDKQVFAMPKGTVSEPVRTQFGWHIIKVHEFKEESGATSRDKVLQVHASHILIKVTASRETIDQFYRRLEDFRTAALTDGFFKAAQDLELPVRTTGPFFRGGNIQYIGNDANASQLAFEKPVNEISEVYENNSAVFVAQVASKLPAGLASFEEVQEKVKMDMVKSLVATLCQDTAKAIYTEIQRGTDISRAAQRFGAEYVITEPFSRDAFVKGIGRDPVAIGAAFSLKTVGQMIGPVNFDQGSVIFKLLERNSPDLTVFTAQRDSIYSNILMTKQQELYGRWFDELVKASNIQNNIQQAAL